MLYIVTGEDAPASQVVTMNCRIALLGTSIAIDSIAAALAVVPGVDLLRFECSPAQCFAELIVLAPDAVVFEMGSAPLDGPILELMTYPGWLLIGCDLPSQQMILFSGEPARLATVDDLLQVIEAGNGRQEPVTLED